MCHFLHMPLSDGAGGDLVDIHLGDYMTFVIDNLPTLRNSDETLMHVGRMTVI